MKIKMNEKGDKLTIKAETPYDMVFLQRVQRYAASIKSTCALRSFVKTGTVEQPTWRTMCRICGKFTLGWAKDRCVACATRADAEVPFFWWKEL